MKFNFKFQLTFLGSCNWSIYTSFNMVSESHVKSHQTYSLVALFNRVGHSLNIINHNGCASCSHCRKLLFTRPKKTGQFVTIKLEHFMILTARKVVLRGLKYKALKEDQVSKRKICNFNWIICNRAHRTSFRSKAVATHAGSPIQVLTTHSVEKCVAVVASSYSKAILVSCIPFSLSYPPPHHLLTSPSKSPENVKEADSGARSFCRQGQRDTLLLYPADNARCNRAHRTSLRS